jgi:hypothetical protein
MEPAKDLPLWKKLGWFVALWAGGVITVVAFGYLMRFLIPG